jgi:DNA polymerase III subunit delta
MITLVHGSDSFSSLERAKSLLDQLKSEHPAAEIFVEDFSEKNLSLLFQIMEGQSLFSTEKVALLRCISINKDFKDYQDKIFEIFKNLSDSIHLVVWEAHKVAANTKYAKLFKELKAEEIFEEMRKPEVKKFASAQAEKVGIKLSLEALESLTFNTNYNISVIKNELDKLASTGKTEISKDDISEIVSNTNESLIWDLTDAITESDRNKALKAIDSLLKNESEQFIIIPMIGRQIKLMIQVKVLQKKNATYSDVARELRLPPFIVSKIIKYVEATSLEKLKKIFIKLVDMDYAIKIGRMEPEIALSLFCTLI